MTEPILDFGFWMLDFGFWIGGELVRDFQKLSYPNLWTQHPGFLTKILTISPKCLCYLDLR